MQMLPANRINHWLPETRMCDATVIAKGNGNGKCKRWLNIELLDSKFKAGRRLTSSLMVRLRMFQLETLDI